MAGNFREYAGPLNWNELKIEIGLRPRGAGHKPGPNWLAFLTIAARFVKDAALQPQQRHVSVQ